MTFRLIAALAALLIAGTAMAVAEPEFTLVEKADEFELRAYAPMIVAETTVDGSLDDASSAGFRLIADYIFGNNTPIEGGQDRIAMTAPVTVEPRSQKISMTAPVTIEGEDGQWRVHFVMPTEYDMASLPAPNDPRVSLRSVPARNYAVIRFSGFTGEEKIGRKTSELLAWLDSKGIKPLGNPELARYNPPWTLPFMRRNEVMVQY